MRDVFAASSFPLRPVRTHEEEWMDLPGQDLWPRSRTKGWSALLKRGAWSLLTTREKLGEVAQDRFRGIFLGEVGAVGDRPEPRARDRRVELFPSLQR